MRHRLDPSHVRPKRGLAHGYELKHAAAPSLPDGEPLRVWWMGREVGRPAQSRREVEKEGGGRVYYEAPYVWLSLPGDVDPASGSGEILLDVPALQAPAAPFEEARPLLITCQQRSGSTALLYALGEVGPYRGPLQLHVGTEVEGYWQWQCLREPLAHPLVSPFGAHARGIQGDVGHMGLLDRSGLLERALENSARQIHATYSEASATAGTWIDKSPGYEIVPLSALFAALFPAGRLLFLTREPIACVLSGVRLEGRSVADTRGPAAWLHVLDVAASWSVSHYLWRHYARPWLAADRYREVSAQDLRERPEEVLDEVRRLLSLSATTEELHAKLREVPVPRWTGKEEEYPSSIRGLAGALTTREAELWGHPARPSTALSAALRRRYSKVLRRKLQFVGLHTEAARAATAWLSGSGAREPEPPARPGEWLHSRLENEP